MQFFANRAVTPDSPWEGIGSVLLPAPPAGGGSRCHRSPCRSLSESAARQGRSAAKEDMHDI